MTRSPWLRVRAARLAALLTLAFAPAPALPSLSLAAQRDSQAYSTKDTPQRAWRRDILTVCGFRFYFTPLAGVLFAFPSRYCCAVGSRLVFSLGSWSTQLQTGFLVPRPTQAPRHEVRRVSLTRLSRSLERLSRHFCCASVFSKLHGSSPRGPSTRCALRRSRLGSSAFARRYLRNLF